MQTKFVIQRINEIPYATVPISLLVNLISFVKLEQDLQHMPKEIIFQLDDIEGVYRTETMISLEETLMIRKG